MKPEWNYSILGVVWIFHSVWREKCSLEDSGVAMPSRIPHCLWSVWHWEWYCNNKLQTANAQGDGWRSPWCGHCWQTRGGPTNLIPQSGISNSCAQLAKNDAVTWIMTSLEDHRQQNSRRDFPKHPPALMVSWGFPVRISTDCLWLKGNWSWFKITSGCQQWPLQLCYPQHKLLYTSVPSLILVFLRPKYIWIQPLLRVESYKWSVCEKHSRIFKNNSLANTIPCSE